MKQSRVLNQAMGLTLALGMAGCAANQLPGVQAPTIQGSQASKIGAAVKLSGTLKLTIRWPNRNYNTNLLPDSTDRIVVDVKQGSEVKATIEKARAASESTVTTTLLVQAGSGYDIDVRGYRGTTLVAHGSASGVTIRVGEFTRPVVTMAPETAPRIESVKNDQGASVAKAGDQITLKGANFGNEEALSLNVTLGGLAIASGSVTREGTDSIKVTVPAEAKSGWVKVKVDGVDSDSSNPLWIIDSLSLPATASMLNGATLPLVPVIGWMTNGTESADLYGTPPEPSYTVSPDAQGIFTGNVFTANASSVTPGNVILNVIASLAGINTSPMAITVRPVIDSVTINSTGATINATSAGTGDQTSYPTTVDLNATVTGDSFNQGVNWTSGDPTLATVDTTGLVTSNNTGKAGSVTITATSKDDSSKSAQVTLTVTNNGDVAVEVN